MPHALIGKVLHRVFSQHEPPPAHNITLSDIYIYIYGFHYNYIHCTSLHKGSGRLICPLLVCFWFIPSSIFYHFLLKISVHFKLPTILVSPQKLRRAPLGSAFRAWRTGWQSMPMSHCETPQVTLGRSFLFFLCITYCQNLQIIRYYKNQNHSM